jgi:hypothetical protein
VSFRPRLVRIAFAAQFALLDLALRGPRSWLASPALALAALASVGVWWHVPAIARRELRVALAFVAGTIVATQIGFYRYYHVFYGVDAAGAARFMWGDTKPMLLRIAPWLALASVLATALELLVLRAAERTKTPRWLAVVALAALAGATFASGDGPPDASAFAALVRFAAPPKAKTNATVVVPEVRPPRPPGAVLLILDESIRASDYCRGSGATCELAPLTAAATPDRVAFGEMRAVASYTALSVSALLTGHLPIEGQHAIATAPLVFDYVRALRFGDGTRPTLHYVSAQTESFFERQNLRAELETFVSVADLVGHPVDDIDDVIDAGIDQKLADRAEAELAKLHPPFMFVAHFGGTHAPYHVDDAKAPFKPYTHATMWSGLDQLHAAYADAIYAQDAEVARVVKAFERAAAGAPSLVLFTSDHGEAFGEHAAIHHGQSLYDEQIRVPGFAVLHDDERGPALAAHADDWVTHLDVVPTILDFFGAWGSFPFRPWTDALRGRSLLRPFASPEAQMLPLTNCTDVFPCPVKTWGILHGAHAYTAQPWDYHFRCVDLHDDTKTLAPNDPECAAMAKESKVWFPNLPYGAKNSD